MRESQFVDEYLDSQNLERPVTPQTFLSRRLRGAQKRYFGGYARALCTALERRVAEGTVTIVPSAMGGEAYIWVQ